MNEPPKFEIVSPKSVDDTHGHGHHGHDHGSGHSHAPDTFGYAFAFGILLNGSFVIGETIYGFIINSVALLADAGHNLFDVLGLLAAWVAYILAKRAPTARYTYGLKSSTILAALFNCMLLLIAVGAISWEALQRFSHPVEVPGFWVMVVAAIGIFTNGATALLFMRGRQDDINIRGAYLHMASDAAVAAGVVAAGFLMVKTGWLWLDPVTSLLIAAVIVWISWSLLTESVAMSMKAVPSRINPDEVRTFLAAQRGVASVHDLHIWATSTTDTALTAHLVMPAGHPGDKFLAMVCEELEHHYGIGHSTLQIETSTDVACAAQCDVAA
ncbi:MAG: cation diffusion facilitator family transporter [Pseudomonadota bacterium]|nr:cation diffusion facilitator family transporter [Pseudomonadota bacterium]